MSYSELYKRNHPIINQQTQFKISNLTVVVAGCGSTGGAAIDGLVRLGVQNFVLLDNGFYEIDNLNRQMVYQKDINQNKAVVQRNRIRAINFDAKVEVIEEGVQLNGDGGYLENADFVFDAVDVTTQSGIEAKFWLHHQCFEHKKATLSALDLGLTQWIQSYNYHQGTPRLHGRYGQAVQEKHPIKKLIKGFCDIEDLPLEICGEVLKLLDDPEEGVCQLACACFLLSALMTPYTMEWIRNGQFPKLMKFDLLEPFEDDIRRAEREIHTQSVHLKLKRHLEL